MDSAGMLRQLQHRLQTVADLPEGSVREVAYGPGDERLVPYEHVHAALATHGLLRPEAVSTDGSISTSVLGMPCRVPVIWTRTVSSMRPLRKSAWTTTAGRRLLPVRSL